MDEDNGDSQRASWTSSKSSHSNPGPHLSDERVFNAKSRVAGHYPNHETTFTSSTIFDQNNVVMTSDRRPILKPIEPQDGLASFHSDPDCTYLSISMHPAQGFGVVVDDSDEFTASLRHLLKYTEGDHFDLQGISGFLSSPDPNLQCAALQMLEHAAEWESTNFTECMPVTFGPVSDLLDSQNLQVHCAALDTLKLFLASPHAADSIQSMMPRVANAVFNDLSSSESLVRVGSMELLEAAARSEEILVEFAAAISHISSILPSMPITTQVAALGVLEVSAGSNSHDLVKVVADTFQSFTQALFSPETIVQIAVLEVLEAGLGTESNEFHRAVTAVLPVLANIISSGESDVQTVARRVLEAYTRPVALYDVHLPSTNSPLLPQPSALRHSQGQLTDKEYDSFSQANVRGAGALPGRRDKFLRQLSAPLRLRTPVHVSPKPSHSFAPQHGRLVGLSGLIPTSFWEAIRRILPTKLPANSQSLESGPESLDQTHIDIVHHLAALQPVMYHENEQPICIHSIDGLPDLSGQIKDKGAFPGSIGGFSDVWKCFWIGENIPVAVTAIRIPGDIKDREKKSRRLCLEAQIWATLDDVHILPLLGITWGFGPLPALVCPWVENGHLTGYLELNHGNLSVGRRFHILHGLVSAVSYLHSRGVIHGDITGSSVLINGQGEPLLADFRLSFLGMELTESSYSSSCKPGNVRWAAPELFIDLPDGSSCRACVKSDIYSVGCVMLQVLSGRVPYAMWTDFKVISEKFKGKEPLRLREAPIDDRHWEFMRRCWRPKQERTVTVQEIAVFIGEELEDAHWQKFGRL
ncbi:kinase-like protein [Rhizopogon salebrosus TDB-379]|nr:kinase-like protein [Rhizopogon salebrosus TDB-379]